MRFQMIVIRAEGEGVVPAMEQFAALLAQPEATPPRSFSLTVNQDKSELLPQLPSGVTPRKQKRAARKAPGHSAGDLVNDPAARETAILAQLAHRPMRIPELADTLCRDKTDVKVMTQRLYPALAKLKKAGKSEEVRRRVRTEVTGFQQPPVSTPAGVPQWE